LVETLGGLPLALTQAGSYIRDTRTTFSAHLEVYMSAWKESMGTDGDEEFAPPDYTNGSVGTTFSVSYEYIKRKNPIAATFLQLLVYYHGSDIDHKIFRVDPEQTLETWQQPPPQIVQGLHSLVSFNRIVRPLIAFSLLQQRGDVLEVHPVIQDWCLSSFSPTERKEHSVLALRMIGTSCNRASPIPFYSEKDNIKERLLMHASRCLALLDSDIEISSDSMNQAICRHLHVIGILFRRRSRFLDALLPLKRAFLGFKRLYGLRDHWTRRFGLVHAMNLIDLNQLHEAEQVSQEILASAESMAGEIGNKGLLERIVLMKTLAEAYWKGGKPKLAQEKFNLIFELMPEDWDAGRVIILSIKEAYAEFLGHQKRYPEAIEVLLAVLRKEDEWNCLDRFSVFRIITSTLFDVSRKAKQFEEVGKQLLCLLSEWEETYGSEDGWTLLIVRQLGFIYYDLGRYDEAERQFRRACNCENTELGRFDEGGLIAAHELAENLRKQNKLTEAAVISQATLKKRESLLGADHLDTLQTRFLISLVMRDQKHYGLAAEFCKTAIEGRRKHRLDKDSLTLEYTNVLAEILFRDNQHSKAIDNWNRILQIKEHLNGSQSIEIVATLFRIGKAYREMGHLRRAEDYFQRCLHIEENAHGPNDSRVHETIFALASCLRDQKKTNEAKTLYLRLYNSLKLSNPDSVMFCDALYLLGIFEASSAPEKLEKLELAESRFKECVEHSTRIMGACHRVTLLATWMLAITYGEKGQLDLAADLLASLVERLISMPTFVDLGKTTLGDMLEEQGTIYWKQGRFEDAITPYRRLLAQSFFSRELPRYGPMVIRANIEDVKIANWLAASDRACDGCLSRSQICENGFYHCLSCRDIDLCAKCLDLFQNDTLPLSLRESCSKAHKFISVPAGSWGADHVFQYDSQGAAVKLDITYEQWKQQWMDEFLREAWRKDDSWMKWLERNRQGKSEV
jgi:tetratricopeptide (TPR) repeat protein